MSHGDLQQAQHFGWVVLADDGKRLVAACRRCRTIRQFGSAAFREGSVAPCCSLSRPKTAPSREAPFASAKWRVR